MGGAGAAALALGGMGGRAFAEPGREVRTRVMTYNIHAGLDAYQKFNIEGIRDAIRETGAEIVGLQEVDKHWSSRSDFVDEVGYLAGELEMRSFFAPILDYDPLEPGQPRRQFGNAILSKHPITDAMDHEILRLREWTTGGFPEAMINVRGARLHFYDTHLDYRSDPYLRQEQVADMLEIVAQDEGQKILVGDLNAEPEDPELSPLWDVFEDAWDLKGEGDGRTLFSNRKTKRIDYVLVAGGVQVERVWVPQTTASDHLPVVADIVLTRGR